VHPTAFTGMRSRSAGSAACIKTRAVLHDAPGVQISNLGCREFVIARLCCRAKPSGFKLCCFTCLWSLHVSVNSEPSPAAHESAAHPAVEAHACTTSRPRSIHKALMHDQCSG
jgi:hypothetical protein